jgi:hypothetical protein
MQEKNRYELDLGKKVGPIELEMDRQTIVSILGEPDFAREGRKYLKNNYHSKNLYVDYTLDTNICKGIEVFNGAALIYDGVDLLGLRWEQFLQWLQENDPDLEEDVGTYTSHMLKIAAGPKLDDDSETEIVESIVVFADNYWSSDEERAAAVKKEIEAMPSLEESARELGLEWFLEP